MNLKNFVNQTAEIVGKPTDGFHLARQGSIYSLTFDELQTTMSSMGKDFGSMNMDELLKSIWNAEDIQATSNNDGLQDPAAAAAAAAAAGPYIQRQGSLTLPRTLSQKTVDQVWKEISNEFNGFGQPDLPQRQQTLGEMTLEEFLVKAGVVREDAQLDNKPNDSSNGLFSQNTPPGFGANGFQQSASTQIGFRSDNLPLTVNGVRSTQKHQNRQANLSYGGHNSNYKNTHDSVPNIKPKGSPVIRNGIMGLSDPSVPPCNMIQGGMTGMVGPGAVTVVVGSPGVSSDGMGKNNGDSSSVSPYEFSGIVRGLKTGAVEKVVERRQRRMIKNRESAARSRARKQAYTMELEAEVTKLKEQNHELKRKAEMMEMQQNQVMEMMNTQTGAKRRRLRKTQSW